MIRVLLGIAGVAAGLYGAWLLSDDSFADLVDVAKWLVGGVVLHDLLLAPVAIALVVVGSRLLSERWRGPLAAAFVVLGSVTLLAIPVLGSFGAKPDNPTLLDRNYAAGWAVVAALTLLTTLAWVIVSTRRNRGPGARG